MKRKCGLERGFAEGGILTWLVGLLLDELAESVAVGAMFRAMYPKRPDAPHVSFGNPGHCWSHLVVDT